MKVTGDTIQRVDLLYTSKDVIMLDMDVESDEVLEAIFVDLTRGLLRFEVGDSMVSWEMPSFWNGGALMISDHDVSTMTVVIYSPKLYNSDRFGPKLWERPISH